MSRDLEAAASRAGRGGRMPEGGLMTMVLRGVVCCLALTLGLANVGRGQTPLQEQLVSEGAASLAKAARAEGDPQRGAILFHQPFLACAKCHAVGQAASLPASSSNQLTLGPDLARIDKSATVSAAALAEALVESILDPSKVIRKGFEPVVVQTADGKTVTGLLVEETAEKLVLRDVSNTAGQGGALVTLSKSQIEERANGKVSIMPAGQVNALAGRSQFLDLARYLIEIAEGGPARAQQLQPPPSLFTYRLPEYEQQIDHAGMLRELDAKAFQRGEAIYNRLCINCHGTKEQPGSLPTSLKFAEGKFKNGADPWKMYQTLTHGFGLMTPQTWMVPQQKYDVIHYVRETYLKPHNAAQHVKIDDAYLASLPKGTTRGPAPSNVEPWSSMNYGPYLIATYEVGSDGSNFAQKGIAVRLDPGPGGVSRGRHWMTFDHDTLRVSAAWSRAEEFSSTSGEPGAVRPRTEGTNQSGASRHPARQEQSVQPNFIDWHGINFDGRHQIHPRVSGDIAFANLSGPGWANPETGTFEELRVLGRDDRRYGPLPRTWGRYRGLYQHGDQAIVSYSVGETAVLEMPRVTELADLASADAGVRGSSDFLPPLGGEGRGGGPNGGESGRDAQAPGKRDEKGSPPPQPSPPRGGRKSVVFTRTFNVGPRAKEMLLKVATHPSREAKVETISIDDRTTSSVGQVALVTAPQHPDKGRFAAGLSPTPVGAKWSRGTDGSLLLRLPPGKEPLKFVLSVTALRDPQIGAEELIALVTAPPVDLASLTKGGPRRWPEVLTTEAKLGQDSGPFAVDVLTPPDNNPWFAQMRLTGFDFFDDGDRAAVCSWDGDVWLVSGLCRTGTPARPSSNDKTDEKTDGQECPSYKLSWQRIANGLFQPLGLKIVNGQIYVTCRDQLAILRDFNGDDETDFTECFNNDHQVTEHFHEFAMGLQTDEAGNFYYAKSGRHALTAVVPHHGTLLRVSQDGSQTDILATGFRAANGVCLNPDGSFVVTDQEGFWNPKNRINWVTLAKPGEKPNFYGNLFGYHDVTDSSDSAMVPPLCWITNAFDRSPAELLWVTSDKWGPLKGSLLNLSYGNGKVFVVPHESVARAASRSSSSEKEDDTEKQGDTKKAEKEGTGWQPVPRQGGMCELPIPQFPTGIMRGRFSEADGQLYVCGMFAWAGNQTQSGGFYRIRATGRPAHAPIGLAAKKNGLSITFTEPLDPATAADAARYVVQTWSLKRTANYGSKHFDEQTLKVANVTLSPDRKTVWLELPDIRPTWGMSIDYKLTGSNGEPVHGLIHNTIHSLGE